MCQGPDVDVGCAPSEYLDPMLDWNDLSALENMAVARGGGGGSKSVVAGRWVAEAAGRTDVNAPPPHRSSLAASAHLRRLPPVTTPQLHVDLGIPVTQAQLLGQEAVHDGFSP